MSWMDSWSRPSANSKIPAPLYLSGEDVPYCHTCGRVMSSKKTTKKNNEIKYCSDRCRNRKPGPLDRKIEKTIAALLNNEPESGIDKTNAKTRIVKGDQRMVITCGEIEEIIFGSRFDPDKVYGRNKNKKSRFIRAPDSEWKSVDMESREPSVTSENETHSKVESGDEAELSAPESNFSIPSADGGVRIRPPQDQSEINFAAGGGERGKHEKIEESAEDLEKRRKGAKLAEEREMVRRAARRSIVFGLEVPRREQWEQKPTKSKKSKRAAAEEQEEEVPTTETRKAEALMNGIVVEPSFAKGNWSIRWRE